MKRKKVFNQQTIKKKRKKALKKKAEDEVDADIDDK